MGIKNKDFSGEQPGETIIKKRSRSLFIELLSFWGEYRRLTLLTLITAVLASFIASLSPETRHSLLTGLLDQRGLVVLLLFFILVTLSLLWSAGQRLDTWIFLRFNLHGFHPLWMDRVMWAATQIGNGVFGLLLGALLYFTVLRRLAIDLLMGILSLWLCVELIKMLIERTRPFLALSGTRVIGWRERGKSFPSGHTSQAFFMTTLLAHHFQVNALLGALLYAVALMVAMTRIYVGAHYPRDVIAGAILGSVWGILTGLVEAYLRSGQI
jgi:membrane-associated phospholipid phosphatase